MLFTWLFFCKCTSFFIPHKTDYLFYRQIQTLCLFEITLFERKRFHLETSTSFKKTEMPNVQHLRLGFFNKEECLFITYLVDDETFIAIVYRRFSYNSMTWSAMPSQSYFSISYCMGCWGEATICCNLSDNS